MDKVFEIKGKGEKIIINKKNQIIIYKYKIKTKNGFVIILHKNNELSNITYYLMNQRLFHPGKIIIINKKTLLEKNFENTIINNTLRIL